MEIKWGQMTLVGTVTLVCCLTASVVLLSIRQINTETMLKKLQNDIGVLELNNYSTIQQVDSPDSWDFNNINNTMERLIENFALILRQNEQMGEVVEQLQFNARINNSIRLNVSVVTLQGEIAELAIKNENLNVNLELQQREIASCVKTTISLNHSLMALQEEIAVLHAEKGNLDQQGLQVTVYVNNMVCLNSSSEKLHEDMTKLDLKGNNGSKRFEHHPLEMAAYIKNCINTNVSLVKMQEEVSELRVGNDNLRVIQEQLHRDISGYVNTTISLNYSIVTLQRDIFDVIEENDNLKTVVEQQELTVAGHVNYSNKLNVSLVKLQNNMAKLGADNSDLKKILEQQQREIDAYVNYSNKLNVSFVSLQKDMMEVHVATDSLKVLVEDQLESLVVVNSNLHNMSTLLLKLENGLEEVMLRTANNNDAIEDIKTKIADILISGWEEWSSWNECTSSCTGGFSTRVQSRTRSMVCNFGDVDCDGISNQSESRPCDSVVYGGDCNNPDSDVYGLAFGFFDELAISVCVAHKTGAFIRSLRRDCDTGSTTTCNQLCKNLGHTCINAVHAYTHIRPAFHPFPGVENDQEKLGLKAYNYGINGCTFSGCGPNFCCCEEPS